MKNRFLQRLYVCGANVCKGGCASGYLTLALYTITVRVAENAKLSKTLCAGFTCEGGYPFDRTWMDVLKAHCAR